MATEKAANVRHKNRIRTANAAGVIINLPEKTTKTILNARNTPQITDPLKSVFTTLYKNGNRAKI
jgi:hypothetical protein